MAGFNGGIEEPMDLTQEIFCHLNICEMLKTNPFLLR
jgi:hypothetical protein